MSAAGSQREAYQPPAAGSSGVGRSYVPAPAGTMFYLCAECGVKVGINKGEPIRCKECGHRILYKQRTTRMVQFEAR
ncbi:DNA directed RNA polymerase [Tuber indicum]|nr:DNA directed RNA polymerase [Tuber indicum]